MPGSRKNKGYTAAFHPPLHLIIISVLLGIASFLVFYNFYMRDSGEFYCAVTVNKNVSDSLVSGLLNDAGFKTVYSESGTPVFFDDFGRLKQFHLDDFRDHIETWDPRDNGYADKLRSFFINGDSRSFFIPLEIFSIHGIVRLKITGILKNIPHSIEIFGSGNQGYFWFLLQLAAVICVFVMVKDKSRFILQIPVILAFSLAGFQGIIFTSVLTGLRELMKDPLNELFSENPYGTLIDRFKPYRNIIIWCFLFVLFYIVLAAVLDISPVLVWTGFISFILIELVSLKAAARKNFCHAPFVPVLILPFRFKPAFFHQSMAVFAMTGLLGSFFLVMPGTSSILSAEKINFSSLPSVNEYYEHMEHQAAFSWMPLGASGGEYLNYYLGADGLIAGSSDRIPRTIPEVAPFPLEKLAGFLVDYRETNAPELFYREWFSVALILLFYIPKPENFLRKKKPVYMLRNSRSPA